jgi:hypothetical protein
VVIMKAKIKQETAEQAIMTLHICGRSHEARMFYDNWADRDDNCVVLNARIISALCDAMKIAERDNIGVCCDLAEFVIESTRRFYPPQKAEAPKYVPLW